MISNTSNHFRLTSWALGSGATLSRSWDVLAHGLAIAPSKVRTLVRSYASHRRIQWDVSQPLLLAVRTVVEKLEMRNLFSWIGATSGSTNDLAHDYNNILNWTLLIINDDFSSATLTANTTIYVNANRTTFGNLNLGYSGNFDLTFESSSTTPRTLTVAGGITGDFGGSTNHRTVTIGNATNPVNLAMNGGTCVMNVNAGDSLILQNTVTAGTLSKTGTGLLALDGSDTYAGGTTLSAGTLDINNAAALGTGALTIGSGTMIDNTSGAGITLSNNNTQNWNGAFTFIGTNALNLGTGAVTLDASATVTTTSNTLSVGGNIGDGGNAYSITKSGTGTLALGGTSSYSGGSVVTAGVLEVYNGSTTTTQATPSALGNTSSSVAVNSGATVWLNYQLAGALTYISYANSFSGAGTLKVTAPAAAGYTIGTAELTGNLSGLTGILDLFPTSGSLGKTSLDDPSNGSQPSAAATIIVENGTTLYLEQALTYQSRIVLYGMGNSENLGALRFGAQAVAAGSISLMSNSSIGSQFATGTISGVISDNGNGFSLTSEESGVVALAAANTYSGGTTITSGTVLVDNTNGSGTGSGPVTVGLGATLGGTGSVAGSVLVSSGGTIQPGSADTAIFSTGSLTLDSGANFDAIINGNAAGNNYDQLNVTGTVAIEGGNLNLSGSRVAQGKDQITLIKNDASEPIIGTFDGLSERATTSFNSVSYAVSYDGGDGNDFVLNDASPVIATAASANPSPLTGTTTNLSVLGDSSGGENTLIYTWSAIVAPVGSETIFSANDTNASKTSTATFDEAGTYTFQVSVANATGDAVTSSVNVTVLQTLSGIAVSPVNLALSTNGSQLFTATALDQFGQAMQQQPAFAWSSTAGSINSSGLFTAPASPVNLTISASSGGITGSTNVVVALNGTAAASPGIVTGTTTALSVLGPAVNGNSYDWTILTKPVGAADPVYSVNNSGASQSTVATFFDAGTYTFQVAISNGSGATTQDVSVLVEQTLNSLIVSPAAVTLHENANSQFSAIGFDQFGNAMVAPPAMTWALRSGLGSVSGSGLYIAPGSGMEGQNTITANSGSVHASAQISVTNASPTVSISAYGNPATVAGVSTELRVLGADDGGEANLDYTWTTTGNPSAAVTFSMNGNNAAKETTAVFRAAGTYTFRVTINDALGLAVTSVASITVNQTLTGLRLAPTSAMVDQAGQLQLSAVAFDQFGNVMRSAPSVDWSVQSGEGSISDSGLYTAGPAAGSAVIRVSHGAINTTGNITIFNLAPMVAVAPAITPDPASGTTAQLSVLGADDSPESDLTYAWSTVGVPPATVKFSADYNNAAKDVTATFFEAGTYTFIVTITDAAGAATSATLTAEVLATLTTINVTAPQAALEQGEALQFSAVACDQFGTPLPTQPDFVWSNDASSGAISATGLYSASVSSADSATITATSGRVSGTATIALTSVVPGVPAKGNTAVPATPPTAKDSNWFSTLPPASLLPPDSISISNTGSDETGSSPSARNDAQNADIIATPSALLAAPSAAPVPVKTPSVPAKTATAEKTQVPQNAPAPVQKVRATADSSSVIPDQVVATDPGQVFSFLAPQSVAWNKMDTAKREMTSETKLKIAAGTATATSVGASAAYLIWLLRGGSLLSSLLSIFPAWKTMDPLPVLESFENSRKSRRRRKELDKESLESLVDDADKPLGKIEPDPEPGSTRKAA